MSVSFRILVATAIRLAHEAAALTATFRWTGYRLSRDSIFGLYSGSSTIELIGLIFSVAPAATDSAISSQAADSVSRREGQSCLGSGLID